VKLTEYMASRDRLLR